MIATDQADYRTILLERFQTFRRDTPKASLRSFAKHVGLTPSNLSDVLKRRCGLSSQSAQKIAVALGFTGYETELFVDLVESENARSRAEKEAAAKRLDARKRDPFWPDLSPLENAVVAKFHYVAVLEFLAVERGPFDEAVFAARLNLTVEQVRDAIETLVGAGAIVKNGDRYVRVKEHIFAQSPQPSESIREFHKQVLHAGERALSQPIEQRKFLSTLLTFDRSRAREAARLSKSSNGNSSRVLKARRVPIAFIVWAYNCSGWMKGSRNEIGFRVSSDPVGRLCKIGNESRRWR